MARVDITREEALKIWLPIIQEGVKNMPECKEALDMAIGALKSLDRAETLLKAAHDLLLKQDNSPYVLDILRQTIFYDEAECDGSCLLEDIAAWLDEKKCETKE